MKFRDDSLLPNVQYARHALSLDDERRTFHPIPWNESKLNGTKEQTNLTGWNRYGWGGPVPMLAAVIPTTACPTCRYVGCCKKPPIKDCAWT